MRDIDTLRTLHMPRTWKQLCIFLVGCSAVSVYFCIHYGVPWLMTAFIGLFFILPLLGAKMIRNSIAMALEAYDGHVSQGAQVTWDADTSGESTTWNAVIDLGAGGKWNWELAGSERPVLKDKQDLPAALTVWLHPVTKEPRLLRTELGVFYPKTVTRRDSL